MVLTASMYDDGGSFDSIRGEEESEQRPSRSTSASGNGGVVQPPSYPPPIQASATMVPASSSATFQRPPVRIVETSTSDWRMMMIVDQDIVDDGVTRNDDQHGAIIEEEDYELVQGGTLILDGETSTSPGNENNSDASLTIPDSDNMPSDPGTIDGAAAAATRETSNDRNNSNWEHLESDDEEDHEEHSQRRRLIRNLRQGRNLYNQTVRPWVARLFPNMQEDPENANEGAYYDLQWGEFSSFTAATPKFMRSTGFGLLMVACFLLLLPAYSYHSLIRSARNHEERWKFLQEENARLQQREEKLRIEMQLLQEEAAAAMAKATSLSREHEKWKLLHGATGNGGNNKDFYFPDEAEECNEDSFTVLDNCWVKAKANVQLGDCGDGTKDFFKNLWDNIWSSDLWGGDTFADYADWEYYAYGADVDDTPHSAMEPYSPCDENGETCQEAEMDPLGAVFSAISSAGHSFSDKLSQLMHEEAANTRKSAAELEDAIHKGFNQASVAISQAMAATKKDIQALSQEVLTTLNAAVPRMQQQEDTPPPQDREKPQTVTRKGLFDAANALNSLSKTWNEAVASMTSTVVEEEPEPEPEKKGWWW
jgi:hypothetical protein